MKGAVAWLVPGQGEDLRAFADLPEIAPVLAEIETRGRGTLLARLLALASDELAMNASQALREGQPQLLDTAVAQPLAVALSLAVGEARRQRGETPAAVAGLSLGELAAMACAGALSAEDAVRAAALRGRLMAEAARARPGGMLALQASEASEVAQALAMGREAGEVVIAGRTSPTQWVLSGDHAALRAILARRTGTLLRVQGAWHSPAMAEVAAPWGAFLRGLSWCPPALPLVLVGRATFAKPADDLVAELLAQLTGPTQWLATTEVLVAHGVTEVEVLGPARTLRALWREGAARARPPTAQERSALPREPSTTPKPTVPDSQTAKNARIPERDPAWLAAHELEPYEATGSALLSLLPQRPPLLLVDRVCARGAARRAEPAVLAALSIDGQEEVFRGHFPDRPVWPAAYTLEGLAQTCLLAATLGSHVVMSANSDEGRAPGKGLGVVAAVKVKFLRLVEPPACLVYFVAQTADVNGLRRFEVRASVNGRDVAAGTLDVALDPAEARA